MESRIFAGICGEFSSTNPLWRNRGEVERFFAGGMVERLWSGNEKLVEKSVENLADAGSGFHSLWKRLCTALHRRFHSGRRRIREISCGGGIFSPHGFSTACGKRCGKPEIFCGEVVESQDFRRNPTFPQETPDRKAGEKKGALRNRFLIRLLQLSAAGEVFLEGTCPLSRCPQTAKLSAPVLLGARSRWVRKATAFRGRSEQDRSALCPVCGIVGLETFRWNVSNGIFLC